MRVDQRNHRSAPGLPPGWGPAQFGRVVAVGINFLSSWFPIDQVPATTSVRGKTNRPIPSLAERPNRPISDLTFILTDPGVTTLESITLLHDRKPLELLELLGLPDHRWEFYVVNSEIPQNYAEIRHFEPLSCTLLSPLHNKRNV